MVSGHCKKAVPEKAIRPSRSRLAKRDRLGLIAFSGTAFLQCPLTIDRNAFVQSVNSLNTDIIPQGGTALGEAINEAIRTFKKEEDNHKVLVLMTDGEDHEEGITGAIQKAKDIGMKVFTIGLGSPAGELIQVRNPQTGKLDFLKDNAGNVVKSRLNESLLRQLSTDTGAFYLPMQGADTIERLYASGLANLTPSRVENQMTKRFIEQFQWPLGLARPSGHWNCSMNRLVIWFSTRLGVRLARPDA